MFVLNRLNWQYGATGFVRMPGEFRVATFAGAEEARAECQKLEAGARTLVNPFAGGCAPFEQSNMPEPVLCDWLRDHDIEPPAPDAKTGGRDWAKWWAAASPTWSAGQSASAWEALDRVRFFEVVEEPERPIVYALPEAEAHYYDAHYVLLKVAYRSRERAEKECAKRNEDVLDEDDGPEDDSERRDPLAPFRTGGDFDDRPIGNWPNGQGFWLVVPIEVEGRPKDRLFVVARVVVNLLREDDCFSGPMEGGHAYSFVRGFGSKAAAGKFCREKVRRAREAVAPGRIDTQSDGDELADGVRKIGLPPPAPNDLDDSSGLSRWWRTAGATATREQRIAVWELLEDVPLFVVLEAEFKG
ncbi:MAG: hypothetical protein J0I06_06865 [Planctomycetes bacterium]|nr:hypothetical protein [Planctomycetota bacterium]